MTARIGYEFDPDISVIDRGFHPAGADGDFRANLLWSALFPGSLWQRIAEGKRRD